MLYVVVITIVLTFMNAFAALPAGPAPASSIAIGASISGSLPPRPAAAFPLGTSELSQLLLPLASAPNFAHTLN